jgi:hypothetical protein
MPTVQEGAVVSEESYICWTCNKEVPTRRCGRHAAAKPKPLIAAALLGLLNAGLCSWLGFVILLPFKMSSPMLVAPLLGVAYGVFVLYKSGQFLRMGAPAARLAPSFKANGFGTIGASVLVILLSLTP